MSLFDEISDKAALQKFIEQVIEKPGVVPPPSLPFKNMTRGSGIFVFTASDASANVLVTHRLGTTPAEIFGSCASAPVSFGYSEENDETFLCGGFDALGTTTGSFPFSWVAFA
jgi:hypothetical protein